MRIICTTCGSMWHAGVVPGGILPSGEGKKFWAEVTPNHKTRHLKPVLRLLLVENVDKRADEVHATIIGCPERAHLWT